MTVRLEDTRGCLNFQVRQIAEMKALFRKLTERVCQTLPDASPGSTKSFRTGLWPVREVLKARDQHRVGALGEWWAVGPIRVGIQRLDQPVHAREHHEEDQKAAQRSDDGVPLRRDGAEDLTEYDHEYPEEKAGHDRVLKHPGEPRIQRPHTGVEGDQG